MPSSKTNSRQVGVQSRNNISILSKSSSKLLTKITSQSTLQNQVQNKNQQHHKKVRIVKLLL